MSRTLFGTDGIRGLVGEYPLDDSGLHAVGRAVGTEFAEAGDQIVIACDTRESSEHFVEIIASGLMEVGVHVVFAGVIPTPALAYITAHHDEFVAGIMITASHNPYEFNGIKIFDRDGGKLPDASEERVNTLIENGAPDRGHGSKREDDFADEYVQFLVSTAGETRFEGLKIAIDAANGAAYRVAGRVFEQLGASVTVISDSPNGTNINERCGATDVAALARLAQENGCDLGVALDGDADRLILVDRDGRVCDGDHILYILAVHNHFDQVVATVMTNLGTEQSLAAKGISLERTIVGDRYVLERLMETGKPLGAEQSGHIILPRFTTTGDGLLAAVQVIKALKESGKTLAEWQDEVTLMPQALVSFKVSNKERLSSPDVTAYIENVANELGDQGRLIIRPSGTEPLVRVMFEGENARARADEIMNILKEML